MASCSRSFTNARRIAAPVLPSKHLRSAGVGFGVTRLSPIASVRRRRFHQSRAPITRTPQCRRHAQYRPAASSRTRRRFPRSRRHCCPNNPFTTAAPWHSVLSPFFRYWRCTVFVKSMRSTSKPSSTSKPNCYPSLIVQAQLFQFVGDPIATIPSRSIARAIHCQTMAGRPVRRFHGPQLTSPASSGPVSSGPFSSG